MPLPPVKRPGTPDSYESDSSEETEIYLDLKDVLLSLPLAEVSQHSFAFNAQTQ